MSSDSSLRGHSLAFSVALCVLSFSLGFLLARGGLLSASGSEGNTQERMGVESPAGDRAQPSWEQAPTEGDLVAEEPSSKGTDFVELLQLAGRVAALQATLDELDPVASDWPEEPPEALRPEAFAGELAGALGEVGAGALELMDCEEYPCVATLVIPPQQEGEEQLVGLKDLMEVRGVLAKRLGLPVDAHFDTHPAGTWLTLSAHPEGVGDARLRQRLEQAWISAAQ